MTALRFYGEQPAGIEGDVLPGRLIVIEGTDGVGRSTHVALLTEWLEARGFAVVSSGLRRSELASRGIGRAKRGNTLDPLTLNLLYATDLWDRLERQVIPALRAGMIALVDRYIYSLIARAVVRGVPLEWIESLYGIALVPDLVIYLDIDVEQLLPRVIGTTGFDYWESGQDFLPETNVYDSFVNYQTQLLTEFRHLATRYEWSVVDARQSVMHIHQDLLSLIDPLLKSMSAPPEPPLSLPTPG